jgi:UDP-glucose 4-epimerase
VRSLVVGGAGFIGSHLVERLLAEGQQVDVVDDLSSGSLANLADARSMGGDLTIHTIDVCAEQFAALVSMRSPDVIYHLGWWPPGDSNTAHMAGAAVHGMIAVLEAARAGGVAKVVTTLPAAALYGEVAPRDQPVKEGQPWDPVGARGLVARTLADLLAMYRRDHAVEFTALALANVYGPRQRVDGGVVARFVHAARAGTAPQIFGDGRQTRDFLFIDDAVDALVRAGQRGSGLVVNIGTGVATSVRDLWTAMVGPAGTRPVAAPARPDDVQRLAVSPTRARIHLAWASWTELSVGLRTLLDG